ncbi:RidA family protein [Tateyamaria sp. Alg231-49]|uniref:RidA family protein n=1 Tax=Tateyamaria sp. Alg231-49 TaxID=1922219 RepID=UPI00131F1939|nr:RidA family protein [Tateyamaria sp. Alg231-49]
MTPPPITRIPAPGTGRSDAVASDGYVYAVATDPECADGIAAQTRNTLHDLDRLLEELGSNRTRLLQATVYLSDIALKPQMDAVWRDWIGAEANWPQRACVGVGLETGYLIEVVVIAQGL